MAEIKWKSEKRKLSDLIPWEKNPRRMTDEAFEKLVKQIKDGGFTAPIIINTDNKIIAGHQRRLALLELGYKNDEVPVRVPNRELTKDEFEFLAIGDNKNIGEFDYEALSKNFDVDNLLGMGFEKWEFGSLQNDLFPVEVPTGTDTGVSNQYTENTPSQEDYESNNAEAKSEEDKGKQSDEDYMPFEVDLTVKTRWRMFELISRVKEEKDLDKTEDVFKLLIDLYDQYGSKIKL